MVVPIMETDGKINLYVNAAGFGDTAGASGGATTRVIIGCISFNY